MLSQLTWYLKGNAATLTEIKINKIKRLKPNTPPDTAMFMVQRKTFNS